MCCCCRCCCGCGGSDNGITTLPSFPTAPALNQFPVYVSYPAFFAGDSAINGANQAIFVPGGTRSCLG